jgi:hypothetical protein
MATKKISKRSIRKLQKVSVGTITVSLPITLIRRLKWRVGQRVVVTQAGNKIVIEEYKD